MEGHKKQMIKENIIQRNFFRLMRSGAFGDKSVIEPMSAFKWRRLYDMVETQKVVHVFARGAEKHKHDEGMNIPLDVIAATKDYMEKHPLPATSNVMQTLPDASMSNRLLNRRFHKIADRERHNIDTSIESLGLLQIIVFNVDSMLNRGMSLDGIIRLGQYLRSNAGARLDDIKIDAWLTSLHLVRMAELQGNILVEVFGFEPDEIPFVHKSDREAYNITVRAVSYLEKDTTEEWHFRQSRSGFVQNNSRIFQRNLRRSMRYFVYAPIETTSNFFSGLGHSLSEIEE